LSSDISVLLTDTRSTKEFAHVKETKAPEGAAAGVTTGGVIGGTLGVLAGIGVLAIPGVGPFIAAGPIVAGLAGLGVGGAVGGLVGALVGMGIPEGKVAELDQHRKVNLSYVNSDKHDYVSVSGHARLLRDPDKMKQLWTPWVEPWFPNGVGDPDLALLEVTIDEAEYWDAPASRMQRFFGLSKALASGDTTGLGEHGKVRPRPNA
jgi:hypothetical protein